MQLIIPAFNEEARLPRTLQALRTHVLAARESGGVLEVIVVDNASHDATAAVAASFDSPVMPVRVLRCEKAGKGAAVRAGMAATTADVVAFMDADGATDLRALQTAAVLVSGGADVAIGSRAVDGSVTMERHSRIRTAGATLYRRLTWRLVPDVFDTQCGFKVFRGPLAREVFAATRTVGFSFDVEVLARVQRTGARIVEFPVIWVDVPGSTFVPARHGLSSFCELAAMALRLRRVARTAGVDQLPSEPAPVVLRPAAEF